MTSYRQIVLVMLRQYYTGINQLTRHQKGFQRIKAISSPTNQQGPPSKNNYQLSEALGLLSPMHLINQSINHRLFQIMDP
jgi:hypothetical protein